MSQIDQFGSSFGSNDSVLPDQAKAQKAVWPAAVVILAFACTLAWIYVLMRVVIHLILMAL